MVAGIVFEVAVVYSLAPEIAQHTAAAHVNGSTVSGVAELLSVSIY